MNKWIAEFELEDGDTMPKHMNLEYKGANIDFHCKPLEQEPFINKPCISIGVCEHDKNKVLDKIRAEITKLQTYKTYIGEEETYVERDDVLAIIDRYIVESEPNGKDE